MTDDDKRGLRPASHEEIELSLSFALRYAGRKRVHHADDAMARITAERLVQHLERSGYVYVTWNMHRRVARLLEGSWLSSCRCKSAGRS